MGKNISKKICALTVVLSMVLATVIFVPTASAASFNLTQSTFTSSGGTTIPYRLYVPSSGVNSNTAVLIYFHSSAKRGTDNTAQIDNRFISRWLLADPFFEQSYVVIAPQCPLGSQWVDVHLSTGNYNSDIVPKNNIMKAVEELVDNTMVNNNVTSKTVAVVGDEMGAYGAWSYAMNNPGQICAIVAPGGGADLTKASLIRSSNPVIYMYGDSSDSSATPYSATDALSAALQAAGGSNMFSYAVKSIGGYESFGDRCYDEESQLLNYLWRHGGSVFADLGANTQIRSPIAAPAGSGQLRISWRNPDSSLTIDDIYLYESGTSNEINYTNGGDKYNSGATNSILLSGLTNGTTYSYDIELNYPDGTTKTATVSGTPTASGRTNLHDFGANTLNNWSINYNDNGSNIALAKAYLDDTVKKEGTYSLKMASNITKASGVSANVTTTVPLTSGNNYRVTYSAKSKNAKNAKVSMNWGDSNVYGTSVLGSSRNTTTDWHTYSYDFTAAASTGTLSISVEDVAEGIWLDNVSVYQLSGGNITGSNLIPYGTFDRTEVANLTNSGNVLSWDTSSGLWDGVNVYKKESDNSLTKLNTTLIPYATTSYTLPTYNYGYTYVVKIVSSGSQSQGLEITIQTPATKDGFVAKLFMASNGLVLPYRIYAPASFGTDTPAFILYMHNENVRGTDNTAQITYDAASVTPKGNRVLARWASEWTNNRYIIVAPQCPEGKQWIDVALTTGSYSLSTVSKNDVMTATEELMNSILAQYPQTAKRVVAAGDSMGGYGAWYLAMTNPTKVAGIIPISGAGDPTKASRLKNMKIWAASYTGDVVPASGTSDMVNALTTLSAPSLLYSPYTELGSYKNTIDRHGNEDQIVNWMFVVPETTYVEEGIQVTDPVYDLVDNEGNITTANIKALASGKVMVSAAISNFEASSKNIMFTVALYDGNKLYNVAVTSKGVSSGASDQTFTAIVTVPELATGNFKIKTMIWDSATIQPVNNYFELK